MRTVIQGSGRSLDEHAAPLRADRLRVVDHPAFVAEQPRGKPRVDDRKVLNGIYWRLRTGSPWDCQWPPKFPRLWAFKIPESAGCWLSVISHCFDRALPFREVGRGAWGRAAGL